jgi:uncharacterized protein YjbI with pentapeptide repeats
MTNAERNPKFEDRMVCCWLSSLTCRAIGHSSFAIGVLLAMVVPSAHGQRAFTVSVRSTNQGGATISWKAQSATPVGDLVIVPQFVVERSADLQSWTTVSGTFSPSLSQTVTFTDTNGGFAFYRVGSIIQKQYAEMSNARLSSGGLAGADFFGARLFAARFDQAILTGARLSAADVRGGDFTLADLSGADLFYIRATEAIFDGATLKGADASFADFEAASFSGTDLRGVDFSFSILSDAVFDFAAFHQVVMDTNTLIDPKPKLIWQMVNQGPTNFVLTNKDLSLATFTNLNFKNAKLNGSDLFGTDMTDSDLRGANFTSADTSLIDFTGTLLDGTTIIDAKSRLVWGIINQPQAGRDLHGTNISSTFLLRANLSGANLTNAICTNGFFRSLNLGGANLLQANFTDSLLASASITNANLTQAKFRFTDLTGASLRNSVTNGTDFTGATFSNTIMPDGSIRNF